MRDTNGIERIETPTHDRKIETVFGRVELDRAGYGNQGCKSLHPLDAELNLPPEIYSLELQRRVAEEAAKNSFDEVVETIAKTTGGNVPKRQAEEVVQRAARDFDAFYETRKCRCSEEETTGSVLAITADGKGVALHERDLREKHAKQLKVDGNNAQIKILRNIAKAQGIDLSIIVDVIHVIEYLWKVGRVFHPESGPELEQWVEHRLRKILEGKAGHMAGGMRRSATRKKISEKKREPVDKCATYLLNKSPYLKYNRYLSKGFPIGTGVIEGACRHLVKDRMEITGAKWILQGAEAVSRLRVPNKSLFEALQGKAKEVYKIGDCDRARTIKNAIWTANGVARKI